MSFLLDKFSTHSKNALKNAFDLALSAGHKEITPQHILYGLSLEKGSIAAQILSKAEINGDKIKKSLDQNQAGREAIAQISLAEETKKLLEKAFLLSNLNRHAYIGTEHLLASVLASANREISGFFILNKINTQEMRSQLEAVFSSGSKFFDLPNSGDFPLPESQGPLGQHDYLARLEKSALDAFGTNLTDETIQQKIDPVIGRENEIERLIQILCRRTKNNPLLLGDPGVGKTAIVEGLAKKIVQGEVPEVLSEKIIYTLDLSSIVAGTSFRGEFENRLKSILDEIKKNENIILFIDEIHNLMGAGSAAGSLDAANILKPALARGEIRCIGATTPEDFKKHIESDPALERRFQPIIIKEPTPGQTAEILQGIKNNYEFFHRVKITPAAIESAINLSVRYLPEKFLPDKAIDLIDEAASAKKIKQGPDKSFLAIKELEKQLAAIGTKKAELVGQGRFNSALDLRQQEEAAAKQLISLKDERKNQANDFQSEVSAEDIARIVAKITGVPVEDLFSAEKKRLLRLEKSLARKIIGQDEALKTVAEFIKRARTGISDGRRPIGSFIFLGPSGVGKTETAKVMAETIFGSPDSLVRIDMSEFSESFNLSKLIGAPAGYVGYKESTKLSDAVKHRPYSLVLFDEIEKAHHQIFNLLLQILEDGFLTDATGRKINFKNTIIVMTSNLGSEHFGKSELGFGHEKNSREDVQSCVIKKLKDKFPIEFLNRIDQTIVFNPLTLEDIAKIAQKQLAEIQNRLKMQGIEINFERSVARQIALMSQDMQAGARAVRQTVQKEIEDALADLILRSDNLNSPLKAKVSQNKIIFE